MSDSGSVASQSDATRVKGVTIVKPIVYGSSSTPFGKKREPDGHTHEWTIYVKPHTNEDISAYVEFRFQARLQTICRNNTYRKVASSRPVYYSIFDHFWGATNQDVLLTEMCYYCYVQKPIK